MSLPAGFLEELRARLSLSDVVGRRVTWDMRKSNQAKGDWWAPCPFHNEKTASFHVEERKGFYYCLWCQASWDAITFVRETENASFMEAVEVLAAQAGMAIPAPDPQAAAKADRRTQLVEVMEQARRFFALQLRANTGAGARRYLAERGLDAAAQERWEIGFAPDAWQGLWDHLQAKGIEDALILAAGLAKPSTKGGRPYDTFRGRIMFPIRDARGRCIAFGGRALDAGDTAKYLNSPETELFDKGRTLFNQGPARAAVAKGAPLIVAEGYMDVIALSEAGFAGAVAPLGTAITADQLAMLWRIAPEPIIALDGDKAGLRAGMRLIDLALPLLEAGQSLRFALLPEGQDPDDLLRAQGAGALRGLLESALPMVQLLWRRETEGRTFDSPERRAALDKTLRAQLTQIRDPSIRAHYGQAIKELRWELFRRRPAPGSAPMGRGGATSRAAEGGPRVGTRNSLLAAAGQGAELRLREAAILAALIACPALLAEFDEELETMQCTDADHADIQRQLLRFDAAGRTDPTADLRRTIGPEALEKLHASSHVALMPCLRHPGDIALSRMTVAQELLKLRTAQGLSDEIAEAAEQLALPLDAETVTWRLSQAAQAHNRALRSEDGEDEDYDTADNGALINRGERRALDDLLDQIGKAKPRK